MERVLTNRQHTLIVTAILLFTFIANIILVMNAPELDGGSQIKVVVLYGAIAFIGTLLNWFSKSVINKLIGHTVVMVPLGIAIIALIPKAKGSVVSMFGLMAIFTLIMCVILLLKQDVVMKHGDVSTVAEGLAWGLGLGLVILVLMKLFGVTVRWWDWPIGIILCCCIGVEWADMRKYPESMNLKNALGCGLGLFGTVVGAVLDIIHWTLSLLTGGE